ncbi:unnamed protein product [Tilletia controversa]|uniref:Uncharacterized protein n=1 Tax=Tilletia controversa TaxID=13291 RepID=A0A8X7MUU0_9BASI|nr:hypothetical protein CF328_g5403 [Tilletia controversa]KAE8249276.1 hypothetical protein A4X06_0g3304 [Tilletia controversa]CAD6906914.1 unnamed protein product [Tilletia controversa]CAD6916776.1 unnamed protein product [Tilletia controversa]CAD6976034.1 unnamed protein product [Tilletia controversa]
MTTPTPAPVFKAGDFPLLTERQTTATGDAEGFHERLDLFLDSAKGNNSANNTIDKTNPLQFTPTEKGVLVGQGISMLKTFRYQALLPASGLSTTAMSAIYANMGPACMKAMFAAVGLFVAANVNIQDNALMTAAWISKTMSDAHKVVKLPYTAYFQMQFPALPGYAQAKKDVVSSLNTGLALMPSVYNAQQKAMVRDWVLWSEDKFLKSAAAVTKKLGDPFQSFTFWNTISYFYPFSFDIAGSAPSKELKDGVAAKMASLLKDWTDSYMKANGLKLPPPSAQVNVKLQEIQAVMLSAGNVFGTDVIATGKLPLSNAMFGMIVATQAFHLANKYLAEENARKQH